MTIRRLEPILHTSHTIPLLRDDEYNVKNSSKFVTPNTGPNQIMLSGKSYTKQKEPQKDISASRRISLLNPDDLKFTIGDTK